MCPYRPPPLIPMHLSRIVVNEVGAHLVVAEMSRSPRAVREKLREVIRKATEGDGERGKGKGRVRKGEQRWSERESVFGGREKGESEA